jgi:hypothetical protein
MAPGLSVAVIGTTTYSGVTNSLKSTVGPVGAWDQT